MTKLYVPAPEVQQVVYMTTQAVPVQTQTIVGMAPPSVVQVPVQVLQNGDGRRALVIPLAGSGAKALSPGRHRLTFRLTRTRWQTTGRSTAGFVARHPEGL